MKPLSLTLTGFQPTAGTYTIDFAGVSAAAITGANGAGKSSVIDGIVFATTGDYRTPTMDGLINTHADRAVVELVFEMDDTTYRIVRTVKRTKQGATQDILFERSDTPAGTLPMWLPAGVADKSVAATSAAIADLLGVSGATLLSTAVARQGDIGRFTQMNAAARKALLWEMLNLDETFGPLHLAAKERLADVDRQVAAINAKTSVFQAAAAELDGRRVMAHSAAERVASLAADVARLESELEQARQANASNEAAAAKLASARAELDRIVNARRTAIGLCQARLDGVARELAAAVEHRDNLQARLARADAYFAGLSDIDADIARAAAAETEARAAADDAAAAREHFTLAEHEASSVSSRAAHEIETVDARLAGLTGDSHNCFTCGTELGDDGHKRLVAELAAQRAAAVAAKSAADTAAKAAVIEQRNARNATAAAQEAAAIARTELDKLNGVQAGITERRAQRQQIVDDLAAADNKVTQLGADQAAIVAELDGASAVSDQERVASQHVRDLESAQVEVIDLNPLRSMLEQARRDHTAAVVNHTNVVAGFEDAKAAKVALDGFAAELADLAVEADTHRVLEKAFGKDGAPALVMEGVCHEIADEANQILARLSQGGLSVGLSTKAATKAGGWADKLTVTVLGPDGERPIESFSGGERLRVDISLRAALTVVLFRRKGARFGTFICDEGWGALDGDGVTAAVDALVHLSDLFDLVLTVTHVPAIAEALPQQIVLSRDGDNIDVSVN